MRYAATALVGSAVALTGAFLRFCDEGVPKEFATAWCGHPPHALVEASGHCPGCYAIAAGLLAVLLALTGATLRTHLTAPGRS